MTNIDSFKLFVKKNPNLITYVRSGDMSWQKFYELYDLYGEDHSVWNDYLVKKDIRKENDRVTTNNNISSSYLSNIFDMVKNIDADKLQNGITSMQKAIGLFGEMLVKDKTDVSTYMPRPIYRKFDD
jgi:hypothetical protein